MKWGRRARCVHTFVGKLCCLCTWRKKIWFSGGHVTHDPLIKIQLITFGDGQGPVESDQ